MHFQCPGFRVLTGVGAPADLPSESGDRGQGASVASPVLPAREQPETGGDTRLLLRDGGGGRAPVLSLDAVTVNSASLDVRPAVFALSWRQQVGKPGTDGIGRVADPGGAGPF